MMMAWRRGDGALTMAMTMVSWRWHGAEAMIAMTIASLTIASWRWHGAEAMTIASLIDDGNDDCVVD